MENTNPVTNLSHAVIACSVGFAIGCAVPPLLPGVFVMCIVMLALEY